MRAERWQRIKEVFLAARELSGEARAAHLAAACGADGELRREVEELLVFDAAGEAFLDTPLLGPRPAAAAEVEEEGTGGEAEGEPRRIGAYRILRPLGRGGMGAVYLAVRDDDEYRKEVAIKLLKRGMDTREIVRRFRYERQILANLEHPNIARLLDGGTTWDGLPYFVMEYVEGRPLDVYCAEEGLSVAARLDLFRTICAAVHFAHQNLVIHRDLKPHNILITAGGTPKLLDFGIAKLLSADSISQTEPLTVAQARWLTPDYASPEQARGDALTIASDVYSLGVLLYELLAGRRPYRVESRWPEEIARVISEVEPPPPSAALDPALSDLKGRRRQLAGDLDHIVAMAMRKEPERRYGSVAQLTDDLRRHQAGLPVLASGDSALYRLGKLIRRHKAAALGVLLVFLFALTMTWQRFEVARERDRADGERAKLRQVLDFVTDLFQVADPGHSRGEEVTVAEVLDRGSAGRFEELGGQPQVRAQLLDTVGEIYDKLGLYGRAQPLVEEALRLRRSAGTPAEVAESLRLLGQLRQEQGQPQEAETLLRDALDLRREALGEEHPETAETMAYLGFVLTSLGQRGEAEGLLRGALAIQRRALGEEHPQVAATLTGLAAWLREEGAYAEAIPLLREALAIDRRLLGDKHPETVAVLGSLAGMLYETGDYEAAIPLLEEALAAGREVLGGEHPTVLVVLSALGNARYRFGDLEGAEVLLREAAALGRRVLGDDHPDVALTLNTLAGILRARQRYPEAERLYRESLAIRRAAFGGEHSAVASALNNLALLLQEMGDLQAAEDLFRETLELNRKLYGEVHPNFATSLNTLAGLLAERGQSADAEALYRQGLALYRQVLPADHPGLAYPLTGLGRLLLDRGAPAEAEPLLREAVDIRRAALAADHWRTAESAALLGESLARQGRRPEAEPLLREATVTLRRQRGDDRPETRRAVAALEALEGGTGKSIAISGAPSQVP